MDTYRYREWVGGPQFAGLQSPKSQPAAKERAYLFFGTNVYGLESPLVEGLISPTLLGLLSPNIPDSRVPKTHVFPPKAHKSNQPAATTAATTAAITHTSQQQPPLIIMSSSSAKPTRKNR